MKISAIDIRKHTFEKIFRGYDPDEVDAFLNSLSQEWERFSSENSLLKMQLEYAEKELNKLKDIESTLFRTLKAAEDTSRLIEKEAHESAEKRIEESRVTANDLVTEAENRTNQIIRETEDRLKRFKDDFAQEIKVQERDFRAIENFRDNLIVQLSSLANNTIETVERFEGKYDKESVLNKMDEIKQHVSEIEIPKKPFAQSAFKEADKFVENEEVNNIILKDDKPEITFEIVDTDEEVEESVEIEQEEEIEQIPVAETITEEPEVAEEKVEQAAEQITVDEIKEIADAQKAADIVTEKEAVPAANRFRNPESNQPKKPGGGGGSFFDQI